MHRFRLYWLLLAGFFLLPGLLAAQKPADIKKLGERAYAQGRWSEALSLLGQYQQQKPGDLGVLTKLGIVHYQLHQPEKARQFLEYVSGQAPESKDPDLFYYLARTLHGQQEYERAIPAYKSFLRVAPEKHPRRRFVLDNVRRCAVAPSLTPYEAIALVENLGERINSEGDEFAPVVSAAEPGRLYFSAAREGATGGRRNAEGYEDSINGVWASDMYTTRQHTTAGWEWPTSVSGLLNTPRHEVPLGFNNAGNVLYFFRGYTQYAGEMFTDTAGRNDEYALVARPLTGPIQPEDGDAAPFFFNDTTLIFASRRPGGLGGLDLYFTVFANGSWKLPENLGPAVNSAYDETTPFLARDGRTLYFSSNRLEGLGGLDVFRTVFESTGPAPGWSSPRNLGAPVNSPGDDAFFRPTPDGRNAYFASDRLDSRGARDIYIAYFKDEQLEQVAGERHAAFLVSLPKTAASAAGNGDGEAPALAAETAEAQPLSPLFYTNDRDVLAKPNLRLLDGVAILARAHPDMQIIVTAHTDETGPAKFDLYYGIKRAEIVGRALTDRGIAASRIVLRSAGHAYPLGLTTVDGAPSEAGRQLNRRLEFALAAHHAPAPVEPFRPAIAPELAARGGAELAERSKGITYRVEAITTRQLLTDEALYRFPDLAIESAGLSGTYVYTAGLYRRLAEATKLRGDLQRAGFGEAAVVAYIDGLRVSKAEAVALLKKYPELAGYIRG